MPFINLKTCRLKYKGLIFTGLKKNSFSFLMAVIDPFIVCLIPDFITEAGFYCQTCLYDLSRLCKTSPVIVKTISTPQSCFKLISGLGRNICQISSVQTLPPRVGQPAEQPAETGSACSATLEQSHRVKLFLQTVILKVTRITAW